MGMLVNPFVFATVGGGGISFVGSMTTSAGSGQTAGTTTIALSGLRDESDLEPTLLENDLVVVNYVVATQNIDLNPTPPTGYTEAADLFANASYDVNQCVWYKFMGASPDTEIAAWPNSSDLQAALAATVHVFRGVDTADPFDVAGVSATGTLSVQPQPAAITPSTAGSWIVVCGASAHSNAAIFTNPGDLSSGTNHFKTIQTQDNQDAIAGTGFKSDWASGAFDPATFGGGGVDAGNGSWAAFTMALRPA